MSTAGLSNLQSVGGVTNIPILNVNALYVGGVLYDSAQEPQDVAALQAQINQINTEIAQIEAITNRIDFTQAPLLVGDLVITEDNKNSVLLTLIQQLQGNIGQINKLDLTALPAAPPASCIITPTTTNQALKSLIDTNTSDISTIQGQITAINTSIGTINAKIAHWNNFTLGSDSMCGVNDGTGFAVALSGSASGNGIFVYPNSTASTAQIQLATAYDKEILIRGGDAVKIYGGNDGSITNRNIIEIGDQTDNIKIGTINGGVTNYPTIDIGVDGTLGVTRDSSLSLNGDVYFSRSASSTGATYITPYTPVLVADTSVGVSFGNCNNFTTDPTFSGLDVLAVAGIAPITLTAGVGNIPITAAVGLISLTALAGGITLETGAGIMTINCGAGGFLLNAGAGVMNFAGGSADINMTTITANITIGAGKGTGVTNSGNTILNAKDNVIIQPDTATEIYKAAFLELNDNATAPPVTANRLYQQADALYWNGQLVQGGSGNQYVLKAGDTMTGALTLPEGITSILTLDNLTTAPTPVTNRLYLLNNVLTFNGVAVGGGGAFVPLAGGTMTGALNIQYDAGNAGSLPPQLNIVNTNNAAPVAGQGATLTLRNDATGIGSIGERCGLIDFKADDSAGTGGRTYASIQGFINDPTSTAIDGRLSQYVTSNNTQVEMLRLISTSTGVRQINLAATNTIIGATAIGATTTDALRVQGSTSITTTLDVPLIQNAPTIYPATSTTLVDGAVRQYRPERVYKLDDYPAPLSAPTMDGEKVFILNKSGSPAGLDQIWSTTDFPAIGGATLNQVIQAKYVEKTNFTPAANYITTLWSDNVCRVFVQADIQGSPLTMTLLCSSVNSNGNTGICDFIVTTYSSFHRLYYGGLFTSTTLAIAGGAAINTTNFSGQIVMSWGASGIAAQSQVPMTSGSTAQDSGTFSNVDGVNGIINCIVDMTGNSGYTQPTPPSGKYDSIVIGGDFTGIDATPSRPLQRIAYYDYYNASGSTIGLYSQTSNAQTLFFYAQNLGEVLITALNAYPTSTTYASISVTADLEYGGGIPPSPASASVKVSVRDINGTTIYAESPELQVNGLQTYTFTTPQVTLPAGGNGYFFYLVVTNINDLPTNSATYNADNLGNPVSTISALQVNGLIGWRTFASSDWSTPVGANAQVRGAQAFSDGYIGFAYSGTTIQTAPQTTIQMNYYFNLYYASGSATFNHISGDPDAIQTGSVIIGQKNCMSGGNPVYPYGAGNAIGYGELYLNRFTTDGTTAGLAFRYTPQDQYAISNNLILTSGSSIATSQLFPQFGTAEYTSEVYRNDAAFPNMYFLAMNTETKTATLSWGQGQAPNYNVIQLPPSSQLPSVGFGGYSDETGYQGLVIYGQFPPNGYIYKGTNAGELVIDISGCVIRTSGDTGTPVIAYNKLTFPAAEDGTSIMLLGDTSSANPYNKPSWWAVSQDGIVIFDNTTINSRGSGSGGVTSVVASGAGITATTANEVVTIANTGVTSIVAGTNITISSTGASGTGDVTINAASSINNGYLKLRAPLINIGNQIDNAVHTLQTNPSLDFMNTFKTGLGNDFDTGGSGSQLRYTGTGWVMVTITFNVGISTYGSTAQDWINLLEYKNGHYQNANFGLQIYVNDENGNVSNRNPNTTAWFLGSNSVYTNTNGSITSSPPNYQNSVTYTCLLTTNYSINATYLTNAYFNSSGSSATINDVFATFNPSEWALTIHSTGAPDH